ncbi:DUF1616 domain-containing protein [Halorussus litoreus]|uniref:DUF1616 domain-containing protein n=1 Tax=Halorussus litoreus TaxID=1710536 RepID=UPI000E27E9F4|nr:DUF1616 domain-containing protein [Halorussus litoreus]
MSLEAADEPLLDRLGRPALSVDLLAVVGYVVVAVALLFRAGVYGTPLAVALGVPLLLFVPGYALVSALFPGATPDDAVDDRTLAAVRRHGLSGVERIALGFGASLALLPILGLAISLSPWPIAPWPALLAVSGFAVGCSAVGAVRRSRRPPDRRFAVPLRAWVRRARRAISRGSILDSAINVGLAIAVVMSVAAIGFAVAAPSPSESYTDVSLLTRNGTGELVAEDYPDAIEQGASEPLVVELTNHEGESTDYSVVVELQRVRDGPDGGARVVEDRRLATFTPSVDAGERWRTTHEVTPTMTGEDLRLTYLVYEGDPPEDPNSRNAYRWVHVWVDVTG